MTEPTEQPEALGDEPSDLDIRMYALEHAMTERRDRGDVITIAWEFYNFLTAPPVEPPSLPPVVMTGVAGPVTEQDGKVANSMQITDTQKFLLTIAEVDSKGNTVNTDTLTWTVTDPNVCSVDESGDPSTYSAFIVAGNPGSTTVVVTDGALSFTETVEVVPGAAATISATEGAPVDQ